MLERPVPNEDLPLLRGRSGILATAGLIIGGLSVALFFLTPAGVRVITPKTPPSLLALNLAFCAMFMGVLAVYRVRGMAGQALVRVAAVAALVLGLAGPAIYARQSLLFRVAREDTELANMRAIVAAARTYAEGHGGQFPADLDTLVKERLVTGNVLTSPYTEAPDYVYTGRGLTLAQAGPKTPLIALHAAAPRGRMVLPVAFADGRADFLSDEQTDQARAADAAERTRLGLPQIPTSAPATKPR